MALEIERKYLVRLELLDNMKDGEEIAQGYLFMDDSKAVRVRIKKEHAWLTIKDGRGSLERNEFEYPIPISDARSLLNMCSGGVIRKLRYQRMEHGKLWEIDVFLEENADLVTAEIELQDKDEEFVLPVWVGEEITGQIKYYNAALSQLPYKKWQ